VTKQNKFKTRMKSRLRAQRI